MLHYCGFLSNSTVQRSRFRVFRGIEVYSMFLVHFFHYQGFLDNSTEQASGFLSVWRLTVEAHVYVRSPPLNTGLVTFATPAGTRSSLGAPCLLLARRPIPSTATHPSRRTGRRGPHLSYASESQLIDSLTNGWSSPDTPT